MRFVKIVLGVYFIFLAINCSLPWLTAKESNNSSYLTLMTKKNLINGVRISRNYENQKQICIKKPVITYLIKVKFHSTFLSFKSLYGSVLYDLKILLHHPVNDYHEHTIYHSICNFRI